MMGNYSLYPFADELGVASTAIRRITSWNEVLADALSKQPDLQVHVITLYKAGPSKVVQRGNLTVSYLNIPKWLNGLTLYRCAAVVALRKLRTIQPDIVHGIGTEHIWPTVALMSGLPSVITIHGIVNTIIKKTEEPLFSRLRYFAYLETKVFHRGKRFIAINPYIRQLLSQGTSASLYDVENPVAQRYFGVVSMPQSSKKILFVGHAGRGKGLHSVIQAFAQLHRENIVRDWMLSVVGPMKSGPYLSDVQRTIDQHQLSAKIQFKGFLLPEQLEEEYKSSAFLVLPSLQETAPMSIAEAMASGLPVIATDVGGIPYMVENGKSGFIASVNNNDALSKAMKHLIENPDMRKQFGNRAREIAESRWQPDKIAKQTVEVYRTIINEATS